MKLARYLIGLLGGATLGVLFAPKKGDDLRKEIIKKGKGDNVEGAKVLLKAFKGAGKEMVGEAKEWTKSEDVQEFLKYGEDKIKDILVNAQDRGFEFASMAQEKLEQLSAFAAQKAKELEAIAQKEVSKTQKGVLRKTKKIQKKVSNFKDKIVS